MRPVLRYFHVRVRYFESPFRVGSEAPCPDVLQGLGGGLIALPSFAARFGLDEYDPDSKELADLKGNIVSILQGGW